MLARYFEINAREQKASHFRFLHRLLFLSESTLKDSLDSLDEYTRLFKTNERMNRFPVGNDSQQQLRLV